MKAYTQDRYQPVIRPTFEVMLSILRNYEHLEVGIANPNPSSALPRSVDSLEEKLKQSIISARRPERNPFTYQERVDTITAALRKAGVDPTKYGFSKFYPPYETPEWEGFMPRKDTRIILPGKRVQHFLSRVSAFERAGWKVDIVEMPEIEGVSLDTFYENWPSGNWKKMVPQGADEFLEEYILRTFKN